MQTAPISLDQLSKSVIAVPPLARDSNLLPAEQPNRQIIRHIENGGVRTLLYGGNANFYHVSLSEYDALLSLLEESSGSDTLVIPSVGPAFGTMMDQADLLREHQFPTVMILPQQEVVTSKGIAQGVRLFAERFGAPIVLYLKHDRILDIEHVESLVNDGCVSFIKYAVVKDDPLDDPYLRELVDRVDPRLIVSGIGEQPAIIHMRDFGLAGFTSGCVCVAPRLSMRMLESITAGDFENAESIRQQFVELEDHRNTVNPIRVLHYAVSAAGIAETGPLLPLLSPVSDAACSQIEDAAKALLTLN